MSPDLSLQESYSTVVKSQVVGTRHGTQGFIATERSDAFVVVLSSPSVKDG
jgi:hypothetical protein